MIESLFVYTALYAIMALCGGQIAKRSKKYEGWSGEYSNGGKFLSTEMTILCLSFALVFGCRWGVGRDYFRYLYAYLDYMPERFEFMFQTISSFLQSINAHYAVYFGIWALFDVVLLYYSVKEYKFLYPYIAFFLIFGFYFLPMMNAIRQLIAAGFFMVSIKYIDQKKIIKFSICYIIAILFHHLAIILFIFYPLLQLKDDWFKSVNFQLIIFALAVIISIFADNLIHWIEEPYLWLTNRLGYSRYTLDVLDTDRFNRANFGRGTGLGIWINIFKTVPIILMSKGLKSFYKSSYFNMVYTLYFLGVLLSLLLGDSVVLNRITYFFTTFQIIIYSFVVYYCFYRKTQLLYLFGIFLILIHIPLLLNVISNPNSTAPFLFFWQ